MRVLLINAVSQQYIPLALHYLRGYALADPGVAGRAQIEIFEPEKVRSLDALLPALREQQPDVVGMSCYVWNHAWVIEAAREIKRALPRCRVVLGGPELATGAAEALRANESVDVIVRGEGEQTFRELVRAWLDERALDEVPGLAFRRGAEVLETARREPMEDLDQIPSPYLSGSIDCGRERRYLMLETYRGCPFKCSYCYYPKDYGQRIHCFSLERVEREIAHIFARGAAGLFLMDPTFNVPLKRARRVLEIIARHNNGAVGDLTTELRVDLIDEGFMELLAAAGFRNIEIGLQAADPRVLRAADRKQSLEKIERNTRELKRRGFHVVMQLIYGLPHDTLAGFVGSLDFSLRAGADRVEAYRLQLLPGTPLDEQKDALRLTYERAAPHNVLATPTMPADDFTRARALTASVDLLHNEGAARHTLTWLAARRQRGRARLLEDLSAWCAARSPGTLTTLSAGLRQLVRAPGPALSRGPRRPLPAVLGFFAGLLAEAFEEDAGAVRALLGYDVLAARVRRRQAPDKAAHTWADVGLMRFVFHPLRALARPRAPVVEEPCWLLVLPDVRRPPVMSLFNGVVGAELRVLELDDERGQQLERAAHADADATIDDAALAAWLDEAAPPPSLPDALAPPATRGSSRLSVL